MNRRELLKLLATNACLSACSTTNRSVALQAEEFTVATSTPGISLFLRNKRPASLQALSAKRTVLLLHGLTYPGSAVFDLPLAGLSWMDHLAQAGFDAWCVDVRGFGRSTRPAAMREPPSSNPPLLDAATATTDIASAVRFITQRRGIESLCLIAWSWGTILASRFAAEQPQAVQRLVLYAPVWRWRRELPVPKAPPGAYRKVTKEAARQNWLRGVPSEQADGLIPPGWFEQWADAVWAADAAGAQEEPPVIYVPNGPLAEVIAHWEAGTTLYEPAKILAPTLITVGEWDSTTPPYMARELQAQLVNAKRAQLLLLPEATHQAFLEKNRQLLFDKTRDWLLN